MRISTITDSDGQSLPKQTVTAMLHGDKWNTHSRRRNKNIRREIVICVQYKFLDKMQVCDRMKLEIYLKYI